VRTCVLHTAAARTHVVVRASILFRQNTYSGRRVYLEIRKRYIWLVFDRGFGFLVTASDISKNMYRQQWYLNPLLKCARSPTQHFIKRECTVLRTAINAIFAGNGKRDTWRGVAVIIQVV
jgi:hypothetical protein